MAGDQMAQNTPQHDKMPELSGFGTIIGLLTLTFGMLLWIQFLSFHNYTIYVSNLWSEIPVSQLNPLDNSPLLQAVFILFGIVTVILGRLKKIAAWPFCVLSLGLIGTLTISGALLGGFGGFGGGFPLQWWWTTLGSCTPCAGEPFFVMLYAFLIDWTIWTLAAVSTIYLAKRSIQRSYPVPRSPNATKLPVTRMDGLCARLRYYGG